MPLVPTLGVLGTYFKVAPGGTDRNGGPLSESDKKRLEKEEELKQQHSMYLLRLLSLNADILRCVYDENKFTSPSNTVEEHIAKTKQKVDHFIEGYVNN